MSATVPTPRRVPRILMMAGLTDLLAVTGASAANASSHGSSDRRQVRFAGTAFATVSNENVGVVGRLGTVD
jgi:hypothetical protein